MSRQKIMLTPPPIKSRRKKLGKNALIMQQHIRQPSFSNISTPVNRA